MTRFILVSTFFLKPHSSATTAVGSRKQIRSVLRCKIESSDSCLCLGYVSNTTNREPRSGRNGTTYKYKYVYPTHLGRHRRYPLPLELHRAFFQFVGVDNGVTTRTVIGFDLFFRIIIMVFAKAKTFDFASII